VHVAVRIGFALLLAGAASGCLGGSPKPRHYTLGAAAAPAGPPLAELPELGLVVGPVDFPRYLDRPEMVVRDGSHGLELSDSHRWAGSLRNDFLRVLADHLGRRVGTERVVTYPNEARFPVTYRVQLELLSFEGTPGANVSLRARWVVASGATGKALAVEESDLTEPTASASWDDLVAAQGRALARMGDEIANRIVALASRPTAE
jgi:uncharacterized protein